MDFSALNVNTILLAILSIGLIYLAIRFLGSTIRIVLVMVGVLLFMYVLQRLGVTLPIISDLSKFFFDAVAIVFNHLKDFIATILG